jgi:hypothetical protein
LDFVTIADADEVDQKVATAVFDTDKNAQLMSWAALDRSDTYTVAGNGVTIAVPDGTAFSRFGIQVKGTGAAPDACVAVLEVGLNGANFKPIITWSIAAGQVDGDPMFLPGGASYPVKYFRSRLVSITLGSATNVVVNIVGMP